MYITYGEYLEHDGKCDENLFQRFYIKAEKKVDYYTFNRLKKIVEPIPGGEPRIEIVILFVELIDLLYLYHISSEDGAPSSVSNDGVSISYEKSKMTDLERKVVLLIKQMLTGYTCKDDETKSIFYNGVI